MDHPAADEMADLVGSEIGAGEHVDAGAPAHRARVDALDFGVRVRRADEERMALARAVEVVGVMATSGDEPDVFLAAHRGADPGRAHGVLPAGLVSYSAACLAPPPPMSRAPAAIALTMLW